MGKNAKLGDIAAGRVSSAEAAQNLGDLHPLYTDHQASAEADRCLYCYDAPCMTACPTSIDVPLFIRQISSGNTKGAATTILEQNIMGGMCARVCPTETLCEQVCVRNDSENKPVKIGRLQRYATDHLMRSGDAVFNRAPETGKSVAVIGGGPAGLSCAHALSRNGHSVVVYDARDKLGGLNEFGIAAYKTVDNFAQREVDFIVGLGGIEIKTGQRLGDNITLETIRKAHDAVFLGIGMGGVNALGMDGEESAGVLDAVDYIADLRQANDPSKIPVGRRVVVIGGGMTAVDIAVQSKLLGAEDVTIAYRRGKEQMNASAFEQELAQTNGVKIQLWSAPVKLQTEGNTLTAIEFARTHLSPAGKLELSDEHFTIEADVVFKAIGQKVETDALTGAEEPISVDAGRIVVDANRKTNLEDVWAGGDCIVGGEDLTVAAVEDGKIAANSIHQHLQQGA